MHVLLVADGRSPITRRWIESLSGPDCTISLISTFPTPPPPGLAHFAVLPVAFGQFARSTTEGTTQPTKNRPGLARRAIRQFRGLFLAGRYVLGPATLIRYGPALRRLVQAWQPDLVHALRIPFEGMLAAALPPGVPLILAIWGNDLTLHARGSSLMRAATLRALRRAQALTADAERDLRLARLWGLAATAPTLAVPGSGGLNLGEIRACSGDPWEGLGFSEAEDTPVVINPRGFRPGSVRNDTFFQSVPLLLQRRPQAVFVCPAMAGLPEALRWLQRLGPAAADHIRLLPILPQERLWRLFHRAQVMVSPSAHDGTPNTLLESMACGAFPVAGDIESVREWIVPGVNGLLVDPGDPQALAGALDLALGQDALRAGAAAYNQAMLQTRAARPAVREKVLTFYQDVLAQSR